MRIFWNGGEGLEVGRRVGLIGSAVGDSDSSIALTAVERLLLLLTVV